MMFGEQLMEKSGLILMARGELLVSTENLEDFVEVGPIARRLACRGASDSEILDAILDAAGPGVRAAVRALQGG